MRASRLPWLTVLAVSVPGARLLIDVAGAIPGRFNDYHAYWLAGRLVAAGGDPYDRAALVELAQREGLEFLVGTGYSYPPPFALLMVPLAALPFDVSAALFSAVSLMAFGIVIAALVQPLRRPAVLAFAAGAYPPVAGSLFIGQANLLVFGLLALGFLFLRQGALVTGLAWGGAAVIKLVPIGLLVPLALARQRQIVLTFLGSVGLYLVLAALAVARTSGGTAAMLTLLERDSYWTNQSLNGVLTRGLEGTAAAEHTSLMVVGATVLFAGISLAILWRARGHLGDHRRLVLGQSFILVAATIAAPKSSFWNHTPALFGVWALLVSAPRMSRSDRALVGAWFVLAYLQPHADVRAPVGLPLAMLLALVTSSGFLGLAGLWLVLARATLGWGDQLRAVDSASANTR